MQHVWLSYTEYCGCTVSYLEEIELLSQPLPVFSSIPLSRAMQTRSRELIPSRTRLWRIEKFTVVRSLSYKAFVVSLFSLSFLHLFQRPPIPKFETTRLN